MAVDKKTRTYLYVGAGAVLLYLLYRHFASTSTSQTGDPTTSSLGATGVDSSQYAALAGQEQSDAAGLQAQEQSDVQNLQSAMGQSLADQQAGLQTITTQEQSDSGALQTALSNLATTVAGLANRVVAPAASVPAAGMGVTQPSRTPRLSSLTAGHRLGAGELLAPFGSSKPNAPAGYTSVGIGSGNW